MKRDRRLRSNGTFLFAALFAATMVGMVPVGSSHAGEYETTYVAEIANQSMWGSGQATAINYNEFFGATWNEPLRTGGVAVDPVFGTEWGAELSGHTSGRIGMEVGADVNSGSVDISQQTTIRLSAPDVINSSQQLVVSSASLFGPGTISTQSPTVSAYADLVLELEADASGRICTGGCLGASGTLVNVDLQTELIALNRDGDGQARILGFGIDSPYTLSNGTISATLTIPNISTTGSAPPQPLASGGTSDLIDMDLNVVNLASQLLTGVPLSGSLAGLIDYNLLSAGVGIDLGIYQNFSFTVTPLITLNVAETGQRYEFQAGVDTVIDPMGFDLLHISSIFEMNGILNNQTGIELAPYVYADILSLSGFGLELGPAFSWNEAIGTYPISLFDTDIPIHFATISGPSFQVNVNPVPEPGTLVLLGSGFATLVGLYRRRA